MVVWTEAGATIGAREGDVSRSHPATALVVVVAVVVGLVWAGRAAGAVALLLVAFVVVQARVASARFARIMDATAAAFGHAVARFLATVSLGAVFAFVVVPVALVSRPFRRRPFGVPRGVAGWTPRAADSRAPSPRRRFGPDPRGRPLRVRRTVRVVALGAVVVVVVDLVAGAVLSGTRVLPGDRAVLLAREERSWEEIRNAPTMRDEPWADQYHDDALRLTAQPQRYVPYLVWGFRPFTSPTINLTDRERRSYRPEPPVGVRPLRVAFLGGSFMFGVGERDEHTIPSEFARIAEEEGVAVEAHNYGMYGWVSWQEYQYLERLLAAGERYDLVVVVDGLNDYTSQVSDFTGDQTHGGSQVLVDLGQDIHRRDYTYPGFLDGFSDLGEAYRANSGLARVVDWWVDRDSERLPGGGGGTDTDPLLATRAAFDVHGRSQAAIRDLARRYDTPVRFYWQPQRVGWPEEVRTRIPAGTTDLTEVFDGVDPPPYVDYAHIDERGARVLARRLWADLGDGLAARATDPSG